MVGGFSFNFIWWFKIFFVPLYHNQKHNNTMKSILFILSILAIGLTSCTDEVCCSVSQEVMNDPLYSGQTELCYGDPDVSTILDKDAWVTHMESMGCHCY